MRAVLQRVTKAHVDVGGKVVGAIEHGLLVLLGVARTDTNQDAEYIAEKILHLRIFPDDAGKMNRSVLQAGGALLVVSQFTLYGDCKKGRRPSFDEAASGDQAREIYNYFVAHLNSSNIVVQTGVFQAEMQVHLVNDGPVTIILESKSSSRVSIAQE